MNTKKIAKLLLGLADSFDTNDPDTTNYRADTLRQIANEIEPQPEPRNDEKSHLTDFEIDTITEFKPLGPLAFIKKLSPLAKTQISRIDDIEGFFARLRGDDNE